MGVSDTDVSKTEEAGRCHLRVDRRSCGNRPRLQLRRVSGSIPDPLYNIRYLHELYTRADPHYTGRATVPALWDKKQGTLVNNESSDIIRMLNSAFDAFGDASVDFYPQELRPTIDALNERIYEGLNNGVYRAGFAATQEAYEDAVNGVFACLDDLEQRLDGRTYLLGERLTETDWRTFMTLIRFDIVYHGLFKCNLRRVIDYPNLSAYLKRLYEVPGVKETVDFDHIKRTYYSIARLNPNGIVPKGRRGYFATTDESRKQGRPRHRRGHRHRQGVRPGAG